MEILLNAPKVKRTHCYCQSPVVYDIICPICGGSNITWSEFESHIWCFDCEKDALLTIHHAGIFNGPIPVGVAKTLGIRFDRICIADNSLVRFESSDELFNSTWVNDDNLIEYIKLAEEYFENHRELIKRVE